MRNALDLLVTRIDTTSADLPAHFDGYRILHVSDIHFGHPEIPSERLFDLLGTAEAGVAVITGDFVEHAQRPPEGFADDLKRLAGAIRAEDGIFATLGNHDTVRMMETFEQSGIHLLANQSVFLHRDEAVLTLTGIDDVHKFHTSFVDAALTERRGDFRILLSHSPDMAHRAARAGFHLYLAGHTHGGQICLPGGAPILTMVRWDCRKYAVGLWRLGAMAGYTTTGAGVSMAPVRFNSRGEIALLTLRKTLA